MATAEFAVAIPAVGAVLALALSGLMTVVDQVKCVDAARATARLVARGDGQAAAVAQGQQLAPRGARVVVGGTAEVVSVSVVGRPARPLAWLGARATPRAEAVAAREEVTSGSG